LQASSNSSESLLKTPAANQLLSAYLRDNNYSAFYEFIEELDCERPESFSRDQYTNVLIFDALSRSRNPERLRSEVNRIKSRLNQSNLSPMELSALFRCLFTHFDGDEALLREFIGHVQAQIEGRNDESSKKELRMILLDVFSKLHEWEKCVELVESLVEDGHGTSVDTLIFGKLMAAAGPDNARIRLVFNWMERVKCWRDPAILISAMDLYFQADRFGAARILWEEVKSRRNRAKSLSIAVSIIARILLIEEGPISALTHLNGYRLLWDNTSVQVYFKASRLSNTIGPSEAESFFFERAFKTNPPPNIDVCNEVLIFIVNREDSLNRLVDWMCESGCHPNVQTINIFLSNTGSEAAFTAAERLIDGMIQVGASPSDELLLRIISAQLERSMEPNDSFQIRAEAYSNLFSQRPQASPQNRLNLYKIWGKYYLKHGRLDKLDLLREEIEKLPVSLEDPEIIQVFSI